jgi:hypothetical protein
VHAGDGRRIEYAVAYQAEPAGPFGDQHAPIREEGDTRRYAIERACEPCWISILLP